MLVDDPRPGVRRDSRAIARPASAVTGAAACRGATVLTASAPLAIYSETSTMNTP